MKNQKLFRETFDVLQASGDCMTEVLNMTMRKKNVSWKLGGVIAAVLCVAVLLSFGVMFPHSQATLEEPREIYENAEEIFNLMYGQFGHYDSALAERYLEPYVYPVSGCVSLEGFTITAEAAAFDPVTGIGFVYYSIENPAGLEGYWENVTELHEANTTGEYDLGPNYPKPYCNYGNTKLVNEASDTKHYVVGMFVYSLDLWDNTDALTKQAIEAGLRDQLDQWLARTRGKDIKLGFLKVGGEDSEMIRIQPDPMAGMEWISCDKGNIMMSPIGMKLCENAYPTDFGRWEGSFVPYSVVIHFADGTEYVIDRREMDENDILVQKEKGYVQWRGYRIDGMDYISMSFERIVDVDQVVGVEINGEIYPVDPYQ